MQGFFLKVAYVRYAVLVFILVHNQSFEFASFYE